MSSGADVAEILRDWVDDAPTLDDAFRRQAVVERMEPPTNEDLHELNKLNIYKYGAAVYTEQQIPSLPSVDSWCRPQLPEMPCEYKKIDFSSVDLEKWSVGLGSKLRSDPKSQHPLFEVFNDCVAQVASGKGIQRHGSTGKGEVPFYDQKWVRLADAHGIGFLSGQGQKKLEEAMSALTNGKCDKDWFEREVLGALNYIAMAVLYNRMEK